MVNLFEGADRRGMMGGSGMSFNGFDDAPVPEGLFCENAEEWATRLSIERALRESEERYRSLIESSEAAITMVDAEGHHLYLNRIAAAPYGKSPEEMVGMTVAELFPPAQTEEIMGNIRKVIKENAGMTVVASVDIAGEPRWFRTSVQPVKGADGVPYAVMMHSTNITDLKQADDKIRKSEEKYRALFNDSPEAYLIIRDGIIIECNRASERLLRGKKADIVGKNAADVSPEFQPSGKRSDELVPEVVKTAMRDGKFSFEWIHKRMDGSEFLAHVNLVVIDYDGFPALFTTWYDITESRKAEERLRKLSLAVEQSPVSIVIADLAGHIEYANPKACETTGYSLEELMGNKPSVLKSGETPDEEYASMWQTITSGKEWKGLFHNKKKNGELYWEYSMIAPVTDAGGAITHFIAIKQDITEQRKIEQSLAENEKRLEQVAAQSRAVIFEGDIDGLITYVNGISEAVYGYTPEELIGKKHVFDLIEEDRVQPFRTLLDETLNKGFGFNNEDKPVRRKDGNLVWVSSNATPCFDEGGNVVGFLGADIDITDRKFAEEELRIFHNVVDQTNYGISMADMDRNFIYVNEAYAAMHGFKTYELEGQSIGLVYTPEQRKLFDTMLESMTIEEGFTGQEVWRRKKDGSIFPALMSAKIIVDDLGKPILTTTSVVDISDLKEKEAQIGRLNIAIEQSPVAIVITDLEAKIRYVSPAFEKITGYSSDEVLGKSTSILKSGVTERSVYEDLWKTVQSGNMWRGEWINKKKSGELYSESVTITPIRDEQGAPSGYLAVKEDITLQKKAEQDRIAREAAEEASKAKSSFLSNVSHEIRTPLNAIIGFAQILKRDPNLGQKQSEQVSTILRSGEHLMELINDILDISRIEAGRVEIKNSDFSLYDLLSDLKMMLSMRAKDKGLNLTVDWDPSVPHYIHSDEAKIRQVLINLIGNSIKFTSTGGIAVRVMGDEIPGSKDAVTLRFEVEDSGVGISEESLKKIFESFYQAEAGMKVGGTGLGLAISKNLVEMMGGQLSADSRVGVGSIFRFYIPAMKAKKTVDKTTLLTENIVGIAPGSEPFRVLVVDDRKDNRDVLRELLLSVGFEVREAENGEEGLKLFEKWDPQAVLMDMSMPVMDGYEATKRLKETEKGKRAMVVAVTASAFGADVDRVMKAGVDGFIGKPLRAEELFSVLSKIPGLHYQYSKEPKLAAPAESRPLKREDVAALPPKLISDMRMAAELGSMAKLRELLPLVQQEDTQVAEGLGHLIKQYDLIKIMELLK